MVSYFGDFPTGATVYIPFNTFSSDDPSASVTITNLVNTDVHVHKNGGTTQRNNAAGVTMSVDYDGITGNHLIALDTSDNTVAGFWVAAGEYQVRVEGTTVDGATVNAWVGAFSIERSGGALALLKNATYGLSAIETLVDDLESRIGTPSDLGSGATVAGNLVDIEAQTDDIGAAGAGLTALATAAELAKVPKSDGASSWNATALAAIQSECNDALVAYDPPTKAELDTAVANVSVDEIQATALADLFNTDSATTYAAAVAGSVVKEIADNAGGSALTEAGIADAVWDEILSGHLGAGSTGNALNAAGSAGDPWATTIPGAYGAGTAGKILGDNINATVSSRATQTSVDTIDDLLDTEVAALTSELAKVPKSDGVLTFNVTCSSDIKSLLATQSELDKVPKSDGTTSWNATALGAIQSEAQDAITASALATAANLATVAGYIDTEVAAILAAVDTEIGALATAVADVPTVAEFEARTKPTADYFDPATDTVLLGNGAHGGAAATLTMKSMAVTNSDAGGIAVDLQGTGTGNSHALRLNSTNGSAISATAGSHAVNVNSSAGNGLVVVGATGDIVADITGTIDVCTTNTDMRGTDNAALAATALSDAVWTNAKAAFLDMAITDIPTSAEIKTAIEAAGSHLALILEDTGTTIPDVLTVIDNLVDDLETRLTATRAGNLDELSAATSGKMAYYVVKMAIALINKMIVTEADGATEQFSDVGASLGSIAAAFSSDGTFTTRKRMVI